MMQTVNLFHVKTHLSKLVDQIASGEESEFVILRNGKPVARMVPIIQNEDVTCRIGIGIAEGEFTVPENIDSSNEEVAKLFYKTSDCIVPQGVMTFVVPTSYFWRQVIKSWRFKLPHYNSRIPAIHP
jgi:antitoxin (DNA-binding transcriptional repressor) of toxin-antitoxin stability system